MGIKKSMIVQYQKAVMYTICLHCISSMLWNGCTTVNAEYVHVQPARVAEEDMIEHPTSG
jgi:hypothetical protein